MRWIDLQYFSRTVLVAKVTQYKSRLFEHTRSMLKWPTESVYIGIKLFFLIYLLDTFLGGREADLEGSITFPLVIDTVLID